MPFLDKHVMIMSEIMTPEKANFSGNIHGGHILNFLDKVAYACAARYSGGYVVTLSVDQVIFREPVHVGELVRCFASVNRVGRTSMEVGIRVEAENLSTGEIRHTNTSYFTMVAVDEHRKPTPVTPLEPKTQDEKRRLKEAEKRSQLRRAFSEAYDNIKTEVKASLDDETGDD